MRNLPWREASIGRRGREGGGRAKGGGKSRGELQRSESRVPTLESQIPNPKSPNPERRNTQHETRLGARRMVIMVITSRAVTVCIQGVSFLEIGSSWNQGLFVT